MTGYNCLFSYPVLSAYNDDYHNCSFSMEPSVKNELRQTAIHIGLKLECDDLQQLIDEDKAVFCVRIDCPFTNLRRSITTKQPWINCVINCDKLNGSVRVEAFVVAMEDIDGFTSGALNEDYEGQEIGFSKGSILALAEAFSFDVPKLDEDIDDHPPIFAVHRAHNKPENSPVEVELSSDVIAIMLCEKAHEHFTVLNNRPNMREVIYSLLVIPAFMATLEKLCKEGCESYSDLRWFSVIKKVLGDKLKIDDDYRIELQGSSFELAQRSMSSPIGKALIKLSNIDDTEGE